MHAFSLLGLRNNDDAAILRNPVTSAEGKDEYTHCSPYKRTSYLCKMEGKGHGGMGISSKNWPI